MTNNVHYHLGLSDGEHAGINFGAVGKHRLIQSEITMYSIQGFDGIIKQLTIKCMFNGTIRVLPVEFLMI